MFRRLDSLFVLGCLVPQLWGCAMETTPPDPTGLTQEAIMERVATFETSGDFTLINAMPLESQHAAERINVWVSSEGVDTYLSVVPGAEDRTDRFADGTVIVKEMLDAEGNQTALTVMAKGGVGGSSAAGNWWWGFVQDGAVVNGGAIASCINCHEANELERSDWVAGVALADRVEF